MSPSDAGEAFIEDLLEASENPSDDDEKSISSEDDFVDDDASQFSTQTIASVQENNIDGRGARQPSNEDDEFAEAEGHENRYFGGVSGATLPSLKERGMRLTIAVEQVAASGGYMMSCVADRIVASPFAVIGSIGVISEIPNVYERLTSEGIQFQTVTAGKFKRTLTPTKKITKEDLKKSEEDIGEIFELFKGWVTQIRPQLDIDAVATGETWFGTAVLEEGLCDEIRTVDDLLLDYIEEGSQVYRVRHDPPPEVPIQLQALFAAEGGGGDPRGGGR